MSALLMQRRQWQPTPVLLPGKSHGWRSLVGCSPWGREKSDRTKRLHFLFSLTCIGGGNGNLLQYSCLENPRDRRAWWAAVYGLAQSRTRLKWLSSSSNQPFLAEKGFIAQSTFCPANSWPPASIEHCHNAKSFIPFFFTQRNPSGEWVMI